MIKQRTFFTVLLCVILSLSIFTVDVYASSLVPVNVNVNLYSVNPSIVSPTSFYYISDENDLSPAAHHTRTDWVCINYTFTSYLNYTFDPLPGAPNYQPGTYSFLFSDTFSFDFSATYTGSGVSKLTVVNSNFAFRDVGSFDFMVISADYPLVGSSGTMSVNTLITGSSPVIGFRIVSIPVDITVSCRCFVNDDVRDISIDSLPTLRVSYSPRPPFTTTIYPVSESNSLPGVVGSIKDELHQQHQEEIDKADQAT
ncbi:MAG: hypothetical protein K2P14_10970, partial [Anaeroplasmataceae bacterium]|nr:hypothetical protein [Anaeroplasmataceae bacterium]